MYSASDRERLQVVVDVNRKLPAKAQAMSYTEDPNRPCFGRDYDRLVHTPCFRRLQGKTQVVTPGQSDFFRTRLTHTIEVAQIARRLAYRLASAEDEAHARDLADVCEAASIMHDFGHPPFGHIGEHALHKALEQVAESAKWQVDLDELGGYEGNAQSFRQVAWAFRRVQDDGAGLQLTRAVLDASMKYPWTYTKEQSAMKKWNYYPSESWAYEWVREGVSGTDKSFEAQIMDWADDVAYCAHDLEDWAHAGYIPLAMLSQSESARSYLADKIVDSWTMSGRLVTGPVEPQGNNERGSLLSTESQVREAIGNLFAGSTFAGFKKLGTEYDGSTDSKVAMQKMRSVLFERFIGQITAEGSVSEGRHQATLKIDENIRRENAILKEMVWIYVIQHPRMATHQKGQREIVSFLVETFASLVFGDDKAALDAMPRDRRERVRDLQSYADLSGNKREILRLIADHVAGMTDSYAVMMHRRLSGQSSGAFNTFV